MRGGLDIEWAERRRIARVDSIERQRLGTPRWWWSPWRRRAWRRSARIVRNEAIARHLGLIPPTPASPREVACSSENVAAIMEQIGGGAARGRGVVLDHAEVVRLTAATSDPVLVRNGMGEVVQVIDANPRPRRPDPTRTTT